MKNQTWQIIYKRWEKKYREIGISDYGINIMV